MARKPDSRDQTAGIDSHGKPLVIKSATPGYVKRTYRIILNEFGVDVRQMPLADWTDLMCTALDHEHSDGDTFHDAVVSAFQSIVKRRYSRGDGRYQ